MEDKEIVELYFNRNEDAIIETKKKYHRYGMKISMNILKDIIDSEECMNETYLVLWNHIPPDQPQYFKYYLGRIVKNIAISVYRKKKSYQKYEINDIFEELENCIPDSSHPCDEIKKNELIDIIQTFLYQKKDIYQKIFLLRYWYGDSLKTIAQKCHLNENQVKVYLHRMRNELKEELKRRSYFYES